MSLVDMFVSLQLTRKKQRAEVLQTIERLNSKVPFNFLVGKNLNQ